MRFFTKEVLDDNASYDKFVEACELNYKEYLKAKKRLPDDFKRIYEETEHFDDDPVPYISIITEYNRFTHGVNNGPPSILRMIICDYDNRELSWEIIIEGIKELAAEWNTEDPPVRIYCIDRSEIVVVDEKYISWEMLFSDGLDLKIVFKHISIRELSKEELEIYKRSVRKELSWE